MQDVDALVGQARLHVLEEDLRVALHELAGAGEDALEQLAGVDPGGAGDRHAGLDAPLEAGHADHEVLVEVRGEDPEEPGPLEDRYRPVLGLLEHALVEREPAELAVREAVDRQAVLERLLVHGLVGGDVEDPGSGVGTGGRVSGSSRRPRLGVRGVLVQVRVLLAHS